MPFIAIMREFEFDAAHRLINHEGKCKYLHGHRYKAQVSILPNDGKLDSLGRVIDFGVVKQQIGDWIDLYWDHNLILNKDDPLLTVVCKPTQANLQSKMQREVFGQQSIYRMDNNPSAENMAKELYEKTYELLPEGVKIIEVKLWETPKCYAVYQPLQ